MMRRRADVVASEVDDANLRRTCFAAKYPVLLLGGDLVGASHFSVPPLNSLVPTWFCSC